MQNYKSHLQRAEEVKRKLNQTRNPVILEHLIITKSSYIMLCLILKAYVVAH